MTGFMTVLWVYDWFMTGFMTVLLRIDLILLRIDLKLTSVLTSHMPTLLVGPRTAFQS